MNHVSELSGRDRCLIYRYFKNVFDSGALNKDTTVAKNATVQNEGGRKVTRVLDHDIFDAIISAGYGVNSKQGSQFSALGNASVQQLFKLVAVPKRRDSEKPARAFADYEEIKVGHGLPAGVTVL